MDYFAAEVFNIIEALIYCTKPGKENLRGYACSGSKWDELNKTDIPSNLISTVNTFRKSFWHDGKPGQRESFLENRKALMRGASAAKRKYFKKQ